MTKSKLIAFLSILFIGASIAAYQYNKNNTQVLHKAQSQNQAKMELMARMESQVCSSEDDGSVVMPSREDGLLYLVRPDETLGEAMVRGAVVSAQQERGNCVRADPDYPPDEGEVACHCQDTKNNCGEHRTNCERGCKKDLCKCCPGV